MKQFRSAALLATAAAVWSTQAQVPVYSLDMLQRWKTPPSERAQEDLARQVLMREGEASLSAGEPAAAMQAFQQAALLLHTADTELAIVRTLMQAGEYRQALAFGAHAAGAHRDVVAGTALYAWLLQAGGQPTYALRVLDTEMARDVSGPPLLAEARSRLTAPWPVAEGPLLEAPGRVAPYSALVLPASAQVVGTAVLAEHGRTAVVPLAQIEGAQQVWVRDGLGRGTAAQLDTRFDALGVALLRLETPLPAPTHTTLPKRAPFAGSAGYTLEYTAHTGHQAAWPWLRQGFLGAQHRTGVTRRLGIDTPPGRRGGPVFDAAGQLVGVASLAADGSDAWLPSGVLQAATGRELWPDAAQAHQVLTGAPGPAAATATAATAVPPAPPMTADAVYERGLRLALQVIATR